ncbi:unnamed protein product [Cyclocybe aegerita]|uniref:Polyprotein n=1 Tax=Cyclocybe aegerita TaxID=1973307 RepID=A0A8S0VTC5_CYCAE|nr:unnamed protein product [Cyclocybe aegerita]
MLLHLDEINWPYTGVSILSWFTGYGPRSLRLNSTINLSILFLPTHHVYCHDFSLRHPSILYAVEAKFWGHFIGTDPCPVPAATPTPAPTPVTVTASAVTAAVVGAVPPTIGATATPTTAEIAAMEKWDKDERAAKSLLTQRIPDLTLMRIHSKKTIFKRWSTIVSEYTEKGAYAQTEMRTKFLGSKCPDKGNVREFLDSLATKREQLASVGVNIDEKDYHSTILQSLPIPLSNFASAQLAAARMFSPTSTIAPDTLIRLIGEEYDHQKSQRSGHLGKAREDDRDEVMAVSLNTLNNTGGGQAVNGGGGSSRGCWKCGDLGHCKSQCLKMRKIVDNLTQKAASSKAGGSANVVEVEEGDSDGVFAVMVESDDETSVHGSMPGLQSNTNAVMGSNDYSDADSDSLPVPHQSDALMDSDWFSDVGSDAGDYDDPFWSSEDGSDEEEERLMAEFYAIINTVKEKFDVENAFLETPRVEIYDSGSTRHISPYREDFVNLTEIPPQTLRAANKNNFSATGVGELIIDVPSGVNMKQLHLTEVLYSPEVGYTLVSIGRLDEKGFSTTFAHGKCVIRGPKGEEVGEVAKNAKGLYRVEHDDDTVNSVIETITLDQFHRHMGHILPEVARRLVSNKFVTGVCLTTMSTSGDPFFCESCVYAKATRKSVPKERAGERASEFGGEVHSDLWGPAPVSTWGGRRYYVTFIDDKTRLTHLYLMRNKSDTFAKYREYEVWCDAQLGARVKVLHSDRGGEYTGKEFVVHLKARGTARKQTVHDTPAQNGVAERRNRIIMECVRALLHSSGLPKFLWGEAARHIVWLLNRTSTKAVDGKTPYEAAFGKKPDLREVREWGEKVWVRIEGGNKLGGRVREGRWMGLDEKSKGVRVYWPDKRTVTVERNVYFDKTASSVSRLEGEDWEFIETTPDSMPDGLTSTPSVNTQASTSAPTPLETPATTIPAPTDPTDSNTSNSSDHETPLEPETRSKRTRKPTQHLRDILEGHAVLSNRPGAPKVTPGVQLPSEILYALYSKAGFEGENEDGWVMVADFIDEYAMAAEISEKEALEPHSLAEARTRPDWPLWEKAILEELAVLKAAGTWELVDAPPGANIIGSRWVFRAKKDAAGNVVRYKARLIAQGFSQVPGIDYFDTFALVARLASIRAVLVMAAVHDYEIHQVDVKGAYLNGILTADEVIFMRQPPGYRISDSAGKRLVEIMVLLGFEQCAVDQAVFFKRRGKALVIVLVHVDDCTIVATALPLIEAFKAEVAKHVEITDLGELHWILGIEVQRNRECRIIFLSQRSYIDSIPSPSTTVEIAKMANIPYHKAVGSLMYASLGTCLDITFAVQTVSRYASKPGPEHWEAVKRIFCYLSGTKELWLSFGGDTKGLVGFADADGSMAEECHAISGYAFLLHGGAVSWSAKCQEIISLSTTESEYVAAMQAMKEALWLRSLVSELFAIDLDTTTLFLDNQSAIALTKDHQYHARTKHIDIRFHFIRWIVEKGSIRLVYCPTGKMVADTLTKALPSAKVKHFASELGLVLI